MFSKCCEIKTVSGQVMGKNSKTKKNKNGCSQNGGSVTGLITWRFFFLACYQNCGLESGGSPGHIRTSSWEHQSLRWDPVIIYVCIELCVCVFCLCAASKSLMALT